MHDTKVDDDTRRLYEANLSWCSDKGKVEKIIRDRLAAISRPTARE